MRLLLILIALLPKVAKPELPPEARKKYRAALSAGRALEAKGKLDEAMQQLTAALALAPEDGPTLSEMGVVALRQKHLPAAEDYTRRSIKSTDDQNVKGASLYNLGRILEEKGDKKGAVDAYVASLAARPHHVVRARLATLDAKKAAELDPFTPRPLEGPFKKVADWCKQQPHDDDPAAEDKEHADEYSWECDSSLDGDAKDLVAADKPGKLPAPFRAVRPVVVLSTTHGRVDRDYLGEVYLAVELPSGTWITPAIDASFATFRETTSIHLAAPEVQGGRLVLRWERSSSGSSGCCDSEGSRKRMAVLGVGASGKPSMTPPLTAADHYEETDRGAEPVNDEITAKVRRDFAFAVTLGKSDLVIKVGRGKADMDPDELKNFVGTHPLVFP